MQPLINYVREAVQIDKTSKGYRTVTILRHEDIDIPNLSKEEFIRLMKEDLQKAQAEYSKLVAPENERSKQRYIEYRLNDARNFAERKWKTERKRQEYIKNAEERIRKEAERFGSSDDMFWDFKPHVDNGIPGVCILRADTGDNQLARCYEEWVTSKWWKKGTGWAFKYECRDKSLISCFRPWIDLLMDESSTAERKREQQNLDQAIADWYASVPSGGYTGD